MDRDRLRHYGKLIESLAGESSADSVDLGVGEWSVDFAVLRPAHRSLVALELLRCEGAHNEFGSRWRRRILGLDGSALSLLVKFAGGELLGDRELVDCGRDGLDRLIDLQQPSGEFLASDASVSPESRWYDELTLLHAVAHFAILMPTDARAASVRRAAEFHLFNTQPDHATAEPWALLAFVQYAPPLADQMLLAMSMQYASGVVGIPLLLLRDALYGLRLLERNQK